ncbi:MAG: hypothetical protein ACK5JT_16040 [Hyphomicrobiaceae bacterium]
MDQTRPKRGALGRIAQVLTAACLLAACSTGPELQGDVQPVTRCVDDSPTCIAARKAVLNHMLADHKRGWVNHTADAHTYATGVRLFAFKSKKREMSCSELKQGRREADAAPGVLRGPSGRQLTPAQISRGIMFAGEVSKELAREIRRRCRG